MQKLVLCCLLIVVLVAATEATSVKLPECEGRCSSVDLKNTRRICARNAKTNICTKLRPCRLRETNCERKDLGKAPLKKTSRSRCAAIKGNTGSARCARSTKPRCKRCPAPLIKNSCWKNREGCRLWLNDCVAKQRNCRNKLKPRLQLTRTANWKCKESKTVKPIKE